MFQQKFELLQSVEQLLAWSFLNVALVSAVGVDSYCSRVIGKVLECVLIRVALISFFLFLVVQLLFQGLVLSHEVVETNQKLLIFIFNFFSFLPFLLQHLLILVQALFQFCRDNLILDDECLFIPLKF